MKVEHLILRVAVGVDLRAGEGMLESICQGIDPAERRLLLTHPPPADPL